MRVFVLVLVLRPTLLIPGQKNLGRALLGRQNALLLLLPGRLIIFDLHCVGLRVVFERLGPGLTQVGVPGDGSFGVRNSLGADLPVLVVVRLVILKISLAGDGIEVFFVVFILRIVIFYFFIIRSKIRHILLLLLLLLGPIRIIVFHQHQPRLPRLKKGHLLSRSRKLLTIFISSNLFN